MMNIGFYIPQLFGGGAERVVTSLSNTLAQLGHNVTVITTVRHKDDYLLEDGVKRYVLDEMTLSRWGILNKCIRFKRLRTICREEHLDVLIAFLSGAVNYSVMACLGLKTRVVVSERNSPEFTYQSQFDRIWAKIIFSLSDGVVFQTRDAQAWFPKFVQRKSIVIPNPVKEIYYSVPYNPQPKRVVSVGRLTEQKNYPLLIAAFASVVKVVPDAQLHIYGGGHLRMQLQDFIYQNGLGGNIHLKGTTNDIPGVLSEASVFVMSSDVEGMPNALMEAMTVGVPSVATDCPCGGPHFLLSGGRGLLVPVGDVSCLAEKILVLLQSDELCDEYSLKSKAYMQQFRQEEITSKWLDFMSSLQ